MIDPMILLSLAGLCAVLMVLAGWYARRNYIGLPELPVWPGGVEERLAVVIPARNEQARIGRAVSGLRAARVVVVDDHSSDGTREEASRAGAEVIGSPAPHRYHYGKSNACWAGAQATGERWLLFADADTWYEPAFLPSLTAHCAANEINMASVFPRQEFAGWPEKLLLPCAYGLYFAGVNPGAVNNPLKIESLASGQCLLFRRDAYNFLGGHRAVMGNMLEDAALARRVKRHRMKVAILRGEHLARAGAYGSLGALWAGVERNSFRFLHLTPAAGVKVLLTSIVLASWLPLMGLLILESRWTAACILLCAPGVAWRQWYGSFVRALAAPLAFSFLLGAGFSALAKRLLGISTEWKGRRVA